MNLVVDFYSFSGFKKISMSVKFLMRYLLSGLKKTARNSQNAIKESPPKASQTQKIIFRRGGGLRRPEPPHQGFALDPQGGLSGPLDPSPKLSPPSTLRSGSGPGYSMVDINTVFNFLPSVLVAIITRHSLALLAQLFGLYNVILQLNQLPI